MTASRLVAPSPRVRSARPAGVRLEHLWLLVPLALVFSYASAMPVGHVDFYYHLLNGRLMAEQGGWLWRETVTYAPSDEPLLNLPWLAQLVYYTLHRLGGLELVSLGHALLVTSAFVGVRQVALHLSGSSGQAGARRIVEQDGAGGTAPRLSGSSRLAALGVLGALLLCATNLAVRPQSMSFVLFAWLLWLLERHSASARLPWLVALISALWANLHGSFVLAPLLVGAYLAGALVENRSRLSPRPSRLAPRAGGRAGAAASGPRLSAWPSGLAAALAAFRRPPTRPSGPRGQARKLALALVASALGTLANPLGPAAYLYALAIAGHATIRGAIVEWRPPTLDTLTGALFFASLPVAVVAVWLLRRRLRPAHLLLLLGLCALALSAQRNVVWWGMAVPAVLAGYAGTRGLARTIHRPGLQRSFVARGLVPRWASGGGQAPALRATGAARTTASELPALNAALLAVVALIAALSLPWAKSSNPFLAPQLRTVADPQRPEGVAAFFESHRLQGRILGRMEWGGYLAWRLWPRATVFLDARIEPHPAEVWRDYFAMMGAEPGWQALVERYGADYLVVDPRYSTRLAANLAASPSWRELYRDNQAIVYGRGAG